jgi:hypothetical protein
LLKTSWPQPLSRSVLYYSSRVGWGALAASVPVVMVMVPMVTAPMVTALPTDKQQPNHQQHYPVLHVARQKRHRAPHSLMAVVIDRQLKQSAHRGENLSGTLGSVAQQSASHAPIACSGLERPGVVPERGLCPELVEIDSRIVWII